MQLDGGLSVAGLLRGILLKTTILPAFRGIGYLSIFQLYTIKLFVRSHYVPIPAYCENQIGLLMLIAKLTGAVVEGGGTVPVALNLTEELSEAPWMAYYP